LIQDSRSSIATPQSEDGAHFFVSNKLIYIRCSFLVGSRKITVNLGGIWPHYNLVTGFFEVVDAGFDFLNWERSAGWSNQCNQVTFSESWRFD
jgi:hypothetical protein